MKRNNTATVWREVSWLRPFELADVQELLTHLAALSPRGYVTWETRGKGGKVRYLVGADEDSIGKVEEVLRTHAKVQFAKTAVRRQPIIAAKRLTITRPVLSLKTDNAAAVARAALAVMAQAKADEETVLQVVIGRSYAPVPLPHSPIDPHSTWLDVIRGNIKPASGDSKAAMREKMNYHSFETVLRVGAVAKADVKAKAGAKAKADAKANASAKTNAKTNAKNQGEADRKKALRYTQDLISGLRILESAGVRFGSTPESPDRLNRVYKPWCFPLRISTKELACLLLLPTGEDELPGVKGLHPRLLPAPDWLTLPDKGHLRDLRGFGTSADREEKPLSISPRDSLEHTVILGPTGSGKSTAMLNLVLADIDAGRSVLVIDPKADLVNDVLRRIPEHRINDVVVLDPSDIKPVGFNPLAVGSGHHSPRNHGLVADTVLAVLREIFADSWGVRTQDILSGALLTLAQTKNASLVMLPALLTDAAFRRKIVAGVNDRVGLLPFWAGYEAMSVPERNQVIAPVLNKMRQFILRPELRNVLGQAEPKFNLAELFTERRIVLVPLNKGIVGAENARLLGSLIVGMTWTLALSRAGLPPERRQITSVFIDELQDYLSLPTNLADALAQARGLGVGLTMAHQYRAQLSPDICAGIDANARNKIMFGMNAPDAKAMSAQAPELSHEDFMYLPRFGVYANLQAGGRATGWMSGKTNPMPPPVRSAAEVKAFSQERYGRDTEEVERAYLRVMGIDGLKYGGGNGGNNSAGADGNVGSNAGGNAEENTEGNADAIGRKKKTE